MVHHIDKINLLKQVVQIVSIVENFFIWDILGIYLYGSVILGVLYPSSGIDILIIIDRDKNKSILK